MELRVVTDFFLFTSVGVVSSNFFFCVSVGGGDPREGCDDWSRSKEASGKDSEGNRAAHALLGCEVWRQCVWRRRRVRDLRNGLSAVQEKSR